MEILLHRLVNICREVGIGPKTVFNSKERRLLVKREVNQYWANSPVRTESIKELKTAKDYVDANFLPDWPATVDIPIEEIPVGQQSIQVLWSQFMDGLKEKLNKQEPIFFPHNYFPPQQAGLIPRPPIVFPQDASQTSQEALGGIYNKNMTPGIGNEESEPLAPAIYYAYHPKEFYKLSRGQQILVVAGLKKLTTVFNS